MISESREKLPFTAWELAVIQRAVARWASTQSGLTSLAQDQAEQLAKRIGDAFPTSLS